MAVLVVSWCVAVLVANLYLFTTWRVVSIRATGGYRLKNVINRDWYLIPYVLLGASMFLLHASYGSVFAVSMLVAVLVLPIFASYSTRVRSALDAGTCDVKEPRRS